MVVPEAPLRGQGLALVVRRRLSPRFPAVAGADGSSLLPPLAPSPRPAQFTTVLSLPEIMDVTERMQ